MTEKRRVGKRETARARERARRWARVALSTRGPPSVRGGVGNTLFDEALLKSGRANMGVGSTNRDRDLGGNEIIPEVDPMVKR